MHVEIEENEREFIERLLVRAELLALRNLGQRKMEKDRNDILYLKNKFKKRGEDE